MSLVSDVFPKKLLSFGYSIVALGSVYSVYFYGFASEFPKSFWPFLDAQFIFNHSFLLAISIAFSSFTAYWISDIVQLIAIRLKEAQYQGLRGHLLFFAKIILLTPLQDGLRKKTFTILFSIIVFCTVYAGFDSLVYLINLILGLPLVFLGSTYLFSERNPKSLTDFGDFVNELIDEIEVLDFSIAGLGAFLPFIVFLCLLTANSLGKHRARKLVGQEPVRIEAIQQFGTIIVTTGSGILVASKPQEDVTQDLKFFFISHSGNILASTVAH